MSERPIDQRRALGAKLCVLRRGLGMTLDQVEHETGGTVAVEYLRRLESGTVPFPSPHILFALAGAYVFPYEKLMELIGHTVPRKRRYPADIEQWIAAQDRLPDNARHVLAIIERADETDPFLRWKVRMLWRKFQSHGSPSGWWDEPGGGGLVREDLIRYWRELPAPPSVIAECFIDPEVLAKYGERFADHYPALKTLL